MMFEIFLKIWFFIIDSLRSTAPNQRVSNLVTYPSKELGKKQEIQEPY